MSPDRYELVIIRAAETTSQQPQVVDQFTITRWSLGQIRIDNLPNQGTTFLPDGQVQLRTRERTYLLTAAEWEQVKQLRLPLHGPTPVSQGQPLTTSITDRIVLPQSCDLSMLLTAREAWDLLVPLLQSYSASLLLQRIATGEAGVGADGRTHVWEFGLDLVAEHAEVVAVLNCLEYGIVDPEQPEPEGAGLQGQLYAQIELTPWPRPDSIAATLMRDGELPSATREIMHRIMPEMLDDIVELQCDGRFTPAALEQEWQARPSIPTTWSDSPEVCALLTAQGVQWDAVPEYTILETKWLPNGEACWQFGYGDAAVLVPL